jgi:DNA-binding NarL/FixJ family response regulator
VPVVVLSASDDQPTVLAAINGGAAGYIPKSSSNHVMREALRLVLAGGRYLPPQVLAPHSAAVRSKAPRQPPERMESLGLTERQIAVLRLISRGAPNKLICPELGLAERTVKAHVTAVLRSLNVSSRTQAAVEAVRLGLAEADR